MTLPNLMFSKCQCIFHSAIAIHHRCEPAQVLGSRYSPFPRHYLGFVPGASTATGRLLPLPQCRGRGVQKEKAAERFVLQRENHTDV